MHSNVSSANSTPFHRIVSCALNLAFTNIFDMEDNMKKEFNDELRKRQFLFNHFFYTKKIKYILEGIIFRISPFNYIRSYCLLRFLSGKTR